jgi:coenzyme F420-reducing hydrogenase delta subunit/Pyruvate/2-oxoacid:ferredoxin oxidoreductase delta subunit
MSIAKDMDIILAHGPELSAGGLDYYKLGLWAAGLPKSRILALNPGLPLEELARRLRAFLYRGQSHRVLLAALDPHHRARKIIRLLLDEIRVHPEFLSVLDLQEALGYPDPKACSLKAHHLLEIAASMITRAEPIAIQELPVNSRVLVWGDSLAALKAAVDLADQGYSVLQAFPGPALQPLIPGAPLNQAPGEELRSFLTHTELQSNSYLNVGANLVFAPDAQGRTQGSPLRENIPLMTDWYRAQSHPAVRLLPQARILRVQGSAGNFQVRIETPQQVLEEAVGAMILAPELCLEPGEAASASPHPRVLTQTRLEEILEENRDTSYFSTQDLIGEAENNKNRKCPYFLVAFLGGDSHPLALRRTLDSANKLLSRDNCRVLLLVRNAKVGAPELEADLEEAAASGLIVVKLPRLPALSLEDKKPRLTFFDPVMHEEESFPCDLVILDEVYGPAADSAALAEILGLFPGPGGFLQGDNVRHLPVITNRRGIYVAGPGRAAMGLDLALAEADAAVSEVQRLLGRGTATAPQGRAVIDRGRCVLCLTCHRLCPHGAVSWDNRAIINELACQGCGVCASQCPNEAIQIYNFTDDQVVAALETIDPRLTPKIIAFLCQNSAWEAYHTALKMQQTVLPLGFTPLRMPCAGKIDIDYLLKAFTHGADGVLVLGCHPDNCKSQQGNEHALWRVERAQAMLTEAGVDPRRLVYKTLAANAPRDFLAAVDHLAGLLGTLQAA